MNKKRWQFWLIIIVLGLTIYNILPTVFFYSKPLKKPINYQKAETVSIDVMNRVNVLEEDSIAWLQSFCKMIKVKPKSIKLDKENPSEIGMEFFKLEDAKKFKKFLPRAGNLISFVPAQLNLSPSQVQLDIHLDLKEVVPSRNNSGSSAIWPSSTTQPWLKKSIKESWFPIFITVSRL